MASLSMLKKKNELKIKLKLLYYKLFKPKELAIITETFIGRLDDNIDKMVPIVSFKTRDPAFDDYNELQSIAYPYGFYIQNVSYPGEDHTDQYTVDDKYTFYLSLYAYDHIYEFEVFEHQTGNWCKPIKTTITWEQIYEDDEMHNGRMFRQFIYALKFSEEDFNNIFISGVEKHSVGTPKMVLDIRGKMFKNEIFNRQCETRVWTNFVYGDKYYDRN